MPLNERDYMRRPPPPRRESGRYRGYRGPDLNPMWAIIGLNLLVYFVTLVSSNAIYSLGLVPASFLQRPWTILTAMFVHANFWHVFGNMLTLYFFGRALTQLVGHNKFLLVYFVGGILGNILFLLWGLWQEPFSIAIGASGAVYAVAGALAVMVPNLRVYVYFLVPMPLWVLVLVFMVIFSFMPGVAWQAHLGGLAAGLIAGYFFRRGARYYYAR